jgi:uncharacterized repeat protein (TIGR03806 family)
MFKLLCEMMCNCINSLVNPAIRRDRRCGVAVVAALFWLVPLAAGADPLASRTVRPPNPNQGGCIAGDAPVLANSLDMEPIFTHTRDFRPFHFAYYPPHPAINPPAPTRWYFSTRAGQLYTFVDEQTQVSSALDLASRIGRLNQSNSGSFGGSEQWGLISFAFDPKFHENGRIFVLYNGNDSNPQIPLDQTQAVSRVSRFTLDPGDPQKLRFDPASEKVLIQQPQLAWPHHFDHLAFGGDGMLYISTGDGTPNGSQSVYQSPAQDTFSLKGKVLRLNVNVPDSNQRGYAIPAGNPFASGQDGLPEIYAYGFRNPWRFSFDSETGHLWLGDVGDATWEEVNRVEAGKDYGWSTWEGARCRIAQKCGAAGDQAVPPVDSYRKVSGEPIAVMGGFVYRGQTIPGLYGKYVYGLYGQNLYYAIGIDESGQVTSRDQILLGATASLSSFFTDPQGELYGVVHGGSGAGVYRLAATAAATGSIPPKLSQTGCVNPNSPKLPAPSMVSYGVNAELWSDNASKLRWLAIPDGKTIRILPDGDFAFPAGSVLMKSFSFDGILYETRLLKRHNDGTWAGYSYRWNDAQTDADLVPVEGGTKWVPSRNFSWQYPSRVQCMVCHTDQANFALGPEVRQFNRVYGNGHQLANLQAMGMLDPAAGLTAPVHDLPSLAANGGHVSTIIRARSYLHANCSSCHRGPESGLRTVIDLRMDTLNVDPGSVPPVTQGGPATTNLCSVPPSISDLGIADALLLTPGDESKSIVHRRMALRGLNQMPPLGTQLVHTGGLDRIRAWIRRADVCSFAPDQDGDGVADNADNCRTRANASQWDSDADGFGNTCDGDFNNDGIVNNNDWTLLQGGKGGACGGPAASTFGKAPYKEIYDLNFDGLIDNADCQILQNRLWGKAPG